jgi:hypothetical protein
MTNERMFGLFSRTLMVPVVLVFLGLGCYSIFLFWQQEAIAKELYTWEPVETTNYKIENLDFPEWPEDTSLNYTLKPNETWGDKLKDMEMAMHTFSQNEYTIKIAYQYEYGGEVLEGTSLSPFPELNQQALRDPQLHRYLLRKDNPPLTVYVDPDHPQWSALVRGWAQGARWGELLIGGLLLPSSLAMLYFLLRPARRVEELFK